jgi:hypothetical protein
VEWWNLRHAALSINSADLTGRKDVLRGELNMATKKRRVKMRVNADAPRSEKASDEYVA